MLTCRWKYFFLRPPSPLLTYSFQNVGPIFGVFLLASVLTGEGIFPPSASSRQNHTAQVYVFDAFGQGDIKRIFLPSFLLERCGT
jgi:hypothetical protein